MKTNRVLIFITMAVVFFAISSAQSTSNEQMRENTFPSSSDCTTNDECDLRHKCEDGKCVDPCNPYPCGTYTLCHHVNHEAVCECLYECTGNPLTGCRRMDKEEIYEEILERGGKSALEEYRVEEEKMRQMFQEYRKKFQDQE